MTEDEANNVLGPLVVAFNFTEDQNTLWKNMLEGLDNCDCATAAAADLIRSATDTYVPGWGKFQGVYDRHVNRFRLVQDEEQRMLESGAAKRFPTVDEGIAIAREAYIDECRKLMKEPNLGYFDDMVSPISRQARRDQAKNRTWR
jgi:hypothetical protein